MRGSGPCGSRALEAFLEATARRITATRSTTKLNGANAQLLRSGARLEILVQESPVEDEAGVREEIEQLLRRRHLTPFSVRVVAVQGDPASAILAGDRGEARLVEWTRNGTLVPVVDGLSSENLQRLTAVPLRRAS